MANQIARKFGTMRHDHAAAATADHIASFWDPRMKARIGALLADRPGMFSAAAAAVVARLQAGPVASQTGQRIQHGRSGRTFRCRLIFNRAAPRAIADDRA